MEVSKLKNRTLKMIEMATSQKTSNEHIDELINFNNDDELLEYADKVVSTLKGDLKTDKSSTFSEIHNFEDKGTLAENAELVANDDHGSEKKILNYIKTNEVDDQVTELDVDINSVDNDSSSEEEYVPQEEEAESSESDEVSFAKYEKRKNRFTTTFKNKKNRTLPSKTSFKDNKVITEQVDPELKKGANFVDQENIEANDALDVRFANERRKLNQIPKKRSISMTNVNQFRDNLTQNGLEVTQIRTELNDVEIDNASTEEQSNIVGNEGKRQHKRQNKRKIAKKQRENGNEYTSSKGKVMPRRELQPNPCKSCQNNCPTRISEEDRTAIFARFWDLGDRQEQNSFLSSCISVGGKKRKYTKNDESRRSVTKLYNLPKNENTKVQVCRQFLLATLNIKEKRLRKICTNRTNIGTQKKDMRGKNTIPKNKTKEETREHVLHFIKMLPAVPSHYCRNSSVRKYLPSELRNIQRLYKLYDSWATDKNYGKVSQPVFRKIFTKDFNIGFHMPRKDKCNICLDYKKEESTVEEKERFNQHINEKELAKAQYLRDQKKSNSNGYLCASFDMQKVLGTPHGNLDMRIYYYNRFSVYNETIYESNSQNGYCYIWGESEGKRGCNEICTILFRYLSGLDEAGKVTQLSLYCDSCTGQNKNRAVMTLLAYFLKFSKNIRSITITFLVPGHTYMQVDSVHGAIERYLKTILIWAPSEWSTVLRNVRVKPHPYEVITLTHADFYDFKELQKKIWPDKIKKDTNGDIIKYLDIRQMVFLKGSNEIQFKYSLKDEEVKFVYLENLRTSRNTGFTKLYNKQLEIPTKKFTSLMKMCEENIIKSQYHAEYKSLVCKDTVPLALPETDEEDDVSYELS